MIPGRLRQIIFTLAAGFCTGWAAASPSLDLQVALDPSSRRLNAKALVETTGRDFRFQLHESLKISHASAGGKALPVLAIGQEGDRRAWRIQIPAGANPLQLEYGGTLPALDAHLDHRAVLRGLPPMASSQGSFLPAGGAWYPQPAPLFTYRVALTVPADQRALVPGRLVSEAIPSDAGDSYRAHFEFPNPADGIDLMAGPWVVREKMLPQATGTALRLRTYFPRELDAMAGLADAYLEDTGRYLELYSRQIGPYPFTEFSIVASPLPTGFGMPTLTYLGVEVLKLPFIRATSLGHEVLHNWWGNGVYVDYRSGNWSEGLTTFMADYAYKERESAAAAREMRLGWLRDFAAVPAGEHQALTTFRSRTHGAAATVGYGKSAMVFLMLRDLVGEEAFLQGIRAFWQRHRFRVASWLDLRSTFETASGRNLGVFFDQWLARPGGPDLRIREAVAMSQGSKTGLTVFLEQDAPSYALHLPLELIFPGRSEIHWIDTANSGDLRLNLAAAPESVRLDPDLRVWRRLDRDELPPILRQWVIAAAPRLVLASGGEDVGEAASLLAKRLFENRPRIVDGTSLGQAGQSGPILLAGLHGEIDTLLARSGLPPRPANLGGRGSAQVWTILREGGAPVAVVSARDAEAMKALLRPLPHYGSQSWLLFEGSRVLEKGVWPAPGRPLPVRRQP